MYKNLVAAFAAACFISPVFSQTAATVKAPLKIGFVYLAPSFGYIEPTLKVFSAGYVAGFAIPDVIRGNDAFALGTRIGMRQVLGMNLLVQGQLARQFGFAP